MLGAGSQARPEGIYFGSELKCLRMGVPAEIDAEALRLFFQFTYIPEPRRCFQAERKLPGNRGVLMTSARSMRSRTR